MSCQHKAYLGDNMREASDQEHTIAARLLPCSLLVSSGVPGEGMSFLRTQNSLQTLIYALSLAVSQCRAVLDVVNSAVRPLVPHYRNLNK